MIGSICHRELFVFTVLGLIHGWSQVKGRMSHFWWQRRTVWHLISGCLSLATGTMHLWWHLPIMSLITFWIFLPLRFFFRLSNVSTLWSIFSSYVASCETCCTSGDPVSVSELFCGLGHMWWMKVRLVCLVSFVSRVRRLLAPGSRASRCHRGGADSKQLMRRQPQRKRIKRWETAKQSKVGQNMRTQQFHIHVHSSRTKQKWIAIQSFF